MGVAMSKTDFAVLEAARALGPQIRACADEIERERRLPQPLVDAMAAAGLFKMFTPREFGGGEVPPEVGVRVVEELARADGSAAWCVAFPALIAMAAGTLREDAAWEIFGREPHAYAAGTGAGPGGRAVAVEGGFRVTARWTFTSGCMHATWLFGAAPVYDGDVPRLGPDGVPELRVLFFPAADCQIIDTWHVSGLRGSGSHDFAVVDVCVPHERTYAVSSVIRPRHPGRLYAFGAAPSTTNARNFSPWAALTPATLSAVSLGIARGALDAFAELAGSKAPRGGQALLRDNPVVQAQVGQAEASLRAARAFAYESVREVWERVGRGEPPTPEQRALLLLAGVHAAARAAEVVETVWKAAGASSIFVGAPLERRFRDAHVITQNISVGPVHYGAAGRRFLGIDAAT